MSYLYDGKSFNVLAEGWDTIGQTTSNRWRGNSDRSFNPTSEYLYTNGKAVVRTDVTSKNHSFINRHSGWQHSKNYYTQDNLGSIIGIMDSNGHVDEKYGYDAFGKLVEGRFDYVNKLGYNGKMYDNYSGLVNYGFRDYSPIQMRFTTVDPIKDSNNWYAYVGNDPINKIDPNGLIANWIVGGFVGGGVSAIIDYGAQIIEASINEEEFVWDKSQTLAAAAGGFVTGVATSGASAAASVLKGGAQIAAVTAGGFVAGASGSGVSTVLDNITDEDSETAWDDNLEKSMIAGGIGGGVTAGVLSIYPVVTTGGVGLLPPQAPVPYTPTTIITVGVVAGKEFGSGSMNSIIAATANTLLEDSETDNCTD